MCFVSSWRGRGPLTSGLHTATLGAWPLWLLLFLLGWQLSFILLLSYNLGKWGTSSGGITFEIFLYPPRSLVSSNISALPCGGTAHSLNDLQLSDKRSHHLDLQGTGSGNQPPSLKCLLCLSPRTLVKTVGTVVHGYDSSAGQA